MTFYISVEKFKLTLFLETAVFCLSFTFVGYDIQKNLLWILVMWIQASKIIHNISTFIPFLQTH